MTNYQRLTAKVFGETATATGNEPEIGQFGSALAGTYVGTTDVATIQNLIAWSNGFIDCVTPDNQFPPLPEMTGFGKVLSYHEAYLLQKGIPEWDSATTYYQDDFCRVGHTVYYSLQNENINHNPTTSEMYWKDYFTVGANLELSNLTDAGEDRLHALKGYLESGQSYTDTTLYNDVYGYNHSTFDLLKFTVTGSPTITDDGIITTADSSNYAQLNFDFSQDHTFEIEIKGNNSTATTIRPFNYGYQMYINPNNSNRCLIYVNSGASYQIASITDEALKSNYTLKIRIKKVSLTYTIDYVINGTITGTLTETLATTPTFETYIRFMGSLDEQHSVDLKTLEIWNANGYPVFSGTKTGIDTIKPADYTYVGLPTISADGIASGFSADDYLTTDVLSTLSNTQTFKILSKIQFTSSPDGSLFGLENKLRVIYNTSSQRIELRYVTTNTTWANSLLYISGITIETNKYYYIGVEYDGNYINLLYSIDGENWNVASSRAEASGVASISTLGIGKNYNGTGYLHGDLDLNVFKIYVDGNLIYQPCLLIPYTESSTGARIVDAVYKDRVQDVYNQFGSANYYTIQENTTTNYIVVGSPTISTNYVASGFATGTGIKLNYILDTTKDFSLKGLFNFTSALTNQNVFGVNSNGLLYIFMNSNRRLLLCLSTNTSTWNIANSISSSVDKTIALNSPVWIELKKTGTTYDVNVSYDNQTWINYITTTSSSNIGNGILSNLTLGGHQSTMGDVLQGSVDLKTVKITQNNEILYEAVSEPNATLPYGDIYGLIQKIQTISWCLTPPTTVSTASMQQPSVVIENYSRSVGLHQFGYILFSDGLVIQWGWHDANTNPITLMVPMKYTDYCLLSHRIVSGNSVPYTKTRYTITPDNGWEANWCIIGYTR